MFEFKSVLMFPLNSAVVLALFLKCTSLPACEPIGTFCRINPSSRKDDPSTLSSGEGCWQDIHPPRWSQSTGRALLCPQRFCVWGAQQCDILCVQTPESCLCSQLPVPQCRRQQHHHVHLHQEGRQVGAPDFHFCQERKPVAGVRPASCYCFAA